MADPDDISQLFSEALAETGNDQLSQLIAAVMADTGPEQLSQLIAAVLPASGPEQISQLTIELLTGPEIIPPTDNPAQTFTFDEGLGVEYFMVLQLSDYGEEMRDHVVKDFRLTGKVTNLRAQVYGYGAEDDINVDNLVAGTNSKTGVIPLPDTTHVQRSRRFPVNVKNVTASTLRIDGRWDGNGIRDRIDEAAISAAIQGRRR